MTLPNIGGLREILTLLDMRIESLGRESLPRPIGTIRDHLGGIRGLFGTIEGRPGSFGVGSS